MPYQRSFRDLSGWILLLTIIYAPWAYGCTRLWTIIGLDILMTATGLFWFLGSLQEKRLPEWPGLMFLATGWLLFQGWCMAWNGHFIYDPLTQMFVPNLHGISFLPGSIDTATVLPMMWRYTGLLGIALVAADLVMQVPWRKRVIITMALTGVSIVLLGYAQKLGGAQMVFWEKGRESRTFFATYVYHGNAGAYINLILPCLICQTFLAIRNKAARWVTFLWSTALALVVLAAFVNISKGGMVLTILLLVLGAAGLGLLGGTSILDFCRRHRVVPMVSGFLIVFPVAIFLSSGTLMWRWGQFFNQMGPDYPRLLTAQATLHILPESGALGFGPGTFREAFPHYTAYLGDKIAGFWRYAHEDYLQTLVEWGWIGATVWGFLFFGAIWIGSRQIIKRYRETSTNDQVTLFCAILSLTGIALHGLGDFPLQIASLQFYTAIFVGLCWTSPRWLRLKMKTKRRAALS